MLDRKRITTLADVPAYQLCCGCGVCAYLYSQEIEMVDAPSLGRRPRFFESDKADESFLQALDVCPGIKLAHSSDKFKKEGLIESLKKSWGPIFEVWEGYAADPEIRHKGSSGGAITAISLYCLEQGNMTGVLHIAAEPEKPYLNTTVLSKDRDALLSGIGSRYSPASPCEKLGDVEKLTGLGVVVGKPCDIAAVQNVRKFKKELDSKLGLTVACFCAGTPSTDGTLEMLRQMGVDDLDQLTGLRYRGHGWPGTTKAEPLTGDRNNVPRELSYEESWGDILQKYRQWRCYICPDHTGEFADLAIGDPWYKKREEKDHGRSLILVRSSNGKKILSEAIAKGYLVAEKKGEEVLPASQPNLQNTRARLWGQLTALKMVGAPCPDYSGFSLKSNWMDGLSLRGKLRSVLGTVKRIYVKKINQRQTMFE